MPFLRARFTSVALATLFSISAYGAVTVTLTPSTETAQVGATVTWTATASDSNSTDTFQYQFSVGSSAAHMQVVRAYSTSPTFAWTPSSHEGAYVVGVIVQSSSADTGSASSVYEVTSRVAGDVAVVSATNHPLVALYSVPPCPVRQTARVRFKSASDSTWQETSMKTCDGKTSVNFYVAGMRASTTYTLQHDILNGQSVTTSPVLSFTTGAVAGSALIPAYNITQPASAPNNTAFPVILTFALFNFDPIATDTQGNLIWYLPGFENNGGYMFRPVPGGTFLGSYDDPAYHSGNRRLLREWDLAGNVVRETNIAAINTQLSALGTDNITSFSHEAYRFPNGYTAFIGTVEKVADQGAGPVDVLGDMAVIVDTNMQVTWWWDEFDHLDIKRPAILNEGCQQYDPGCPILYNPGYTAANDWTHSNSLAPTPDGNLVISVRHQDWVIKINYQNGTVPAWRPGQPDNTIIWKFGNDGNFTTTSTDSYPWPTHQHDVEFASNGSMTLFDNGNTRITDYGGNSRGQAWRLDETNLVATLVFNVDLGTYSNATGSAELLSNGNYHFYIGFYGDGNHSQTVEYAPPDSLKFAETLPSTVGYRSFRMASLYSEYPDAGQYFVPITPCRLVDTRNQDGAFGGPSLTAGQVRVFNVPSGACGIPQTATAYSMNVTAVPDEEIGFLTIWPDGETQPNVSTLNSWDGRVKANAAIVPAGNAGAVDVYSSGDTDVILDVNGYFAPTPGLEYFPLTPCRVFDSRIAGGPFGGPSLAANSTRDIAMNQSACSVPSDAVAYSVNITAIPNSGALGYLTAWPSGSSRPNVSTLNSFSGVPVANAAVVSGGTDGNISVFVTDPADVIVDVNGYFGPSSSNGLLLFPLVPCRVLDTRDNGGSGFNGMISASVNRSCGIPSTAQSLVLNATVVPSGPLGYLTLWEAGTPQPYVSTLNAYDGSVTSNMAIVSASSGTIDAYASNVTQLILDASGYFAP